MALDPYSVQARLTKAGCYLFLGKRSECIDLLTPISSLAIAPIFLRLATALALAGSLEPARLMLEEYLGSVADESRPELAQVAETLIALGDVDAAFEWIDRGVRLKAQDLLYLHASPVVDPIRDDPRFLEYLESIHLAGST